MQMGHRFAGVRAVIENQPVAIFSEAQLFRDFGRFNQQMTQHLVIVRMRFGEARDRLLGNDQHMNGRLRFDIVKGNHPFILVDNRGGNFAGNDFLE